MDLVIKNYFLDKLSSECETLKNDKNTNLFSNIIGGSGNERKVKRVELCEKDFDGNIDEGKEI